MPGNEFVLRSTEGGRRGLREFVSDQLPVFMHPIEFSQIAAALRTLAPVHALEWGSGGSTAALLGLCPSLERWVSIEHNPEWAEKVRAAVDDPRLELHVVEGAEPDPEFPAKKGRKAAMEAWMARGENEPGLFADYVARPSSLGVRFDLVLVDGRARTHCLRAGWHVLREGGLMILHDAQRDAYRDTVESFSDHVFLEPWVQGQVCIIRKPNSV